MSNDDLLLVGDSEHDANLLYAVRMFVPDPFAYLRLEGKCHVILSDLEIGRARRNARHCRILSLSSYQESLRKNGLKHPALSHVIRAVLKERKVRRVSVPPNFPHGLARELEKLKIKIKVREGSCFPQREVKSSEEIKKISAALLMAEVGLSEGLQMLKRARIGRGGKLTHNHIPLTSERLRAVIDTAIVQAGGIPSHTIVAGGDQACDPHEQGFGQLHANQTIVLDVFPRSQKTGYFGDITRTVVKGRASEPVRRMYHAVARAQSAALERLTHGARAVDVHRHVAAFFESEGFKTGRSQGRMRGFFHATGHGVGLELHEAPRVGRNTRDILKHGQVVTVEPGLYYPGIGGVRLEDMAHVTRGKARNLTKFEKIMELP